VSGSGDVNISGLEADELSIELNGSGNILVENVDVKTVDISLQGSGDIKLEGKADTQKVRVSGSGNYLAGDLQTNAGGGVGLSRCHCLGRRRGEYYSWWRGYRCYGKPEINQTISGSGMLLAGRK
jgi:hypothetical protein